MSKVSFEENEFHIKSRKLFGAPETPTMIRLLLKSGLVKNEKQAVMVLIGIIIVCVGATWWLMMGRNQQIDYVEAPDGTRYSIEEYVQLLGQGINPLDPEQTEK